MVVAGQKRRKGQASAKHPYLSGNYAPIQQTRSLTPCTYEGHIPQELAGGQYVRNGGNPVSNEDLGRDAHWFDGDGMLSGVSFSRDASGNLIPEFVNQFVLSDVYLSTVSSPHVKTPIVPSIATLVNPLASLVIITLRIMRTIFLVILSFLPGSKQAIKRMSVVNTSIWYHDGRALAGCESGPPMRISLPGLETVGWYDGAGAENEPLSERSLTQQTIGGDGILGFMREWTTAHPKVDADTKEMLLFHASFAPPYVLYSVIPENRTSETEKQADAHTRKLVSQAVPGVSSAKMMHDFGVSSTHTVIMDLPLSLDPLNLMKNRPVVEYDPEKPSRFGVFPRHNPNLVKWFETKACCIFHTANTWDGYTERGVVSSIHMLACRLTSASTVFSAGNIAGPKPRVKTVYEKKQTKMSFYSRYDNDARIEPNEEREDFEAVFEKDDGAYSDDIEARPLMGEPVHRVSQSPGSRRSTNEHVFELPQEIWEDWTDSEEDQCRLYYYNFNLLTGKIRSEYALSRIPFEFSSVRADVEMKEARYVYGCSSSCSSFGAALGKSAKVDVLVKVDAMRLIQEGERKLAAGLLQPVTDCVDNRTVAQVINSRDPNDAIQAFQMPLGWFAQEPRFVARQDGQSEDDGYLLTYAFNEAQLDIEGEVPPDEDEILRSRSELWIIDARDMKTLIGRVLLPQRVPYGLHGTWFPEEEIKNQRPVQAVRSMPVEIHDRPSGAWMATRDWLERILA